MNNIKRGEIYYITKETFSGAQIDPKGGRPAIIVSRNEDNAYSGTVEVVYLTHRFDKPRDTQFTITSGKCKDSIAKCEQVTTVGVEFVGDCADVLSKEDMEELNIRLCVSLGMSSPVSAPLEKDPTDYKKLYEDLLDRIIGR